MQKTAKQKAQIRHDLKSLYHTLSFSVKQCSLLLQILQ